MLLTPAEGHHRDLIYKNLWRKNDHVILFSCGLRQRKFINLQF